jgi:hypothetical protein
MVLWSHWDYTLSVDPEGSVLQLGYPQKPLAAAYQQNKTHFVHGNLMKRKV